MPTREKRHEKQHVPWCEKRHVPTCEKRLAKPHVEPHAKRHVKRHVERHVEPHVLTHNRNLMCTGTPHNTQKRDLYVHWHGQVVLLLYIHDKETRQDARANAVPAASPHQCDTEWYERMCPVF